LDRIDPARAKLPRHSDPGSSAAPALIEEQLSRRAQQSTLREAFVASGSLSQHADFSTSSVPPIWNEGQTL
jgi:hypothetical protein